MALYNVNDTYVRFDVIDYTGSNVLSSFTLDDTPLTFIPDFEQAKITAEGSTISNRNLRWNFGDGTFSTDLRPTHVYKWPGQYTVTLTVFDNNGKAYDSIYKPQIEIYDYISTQILFQDFERLVYDVPAGRFLGPLYINTYNSWQNYYALSAAGCTINLYASGAKGDYNYIPVSSTDKWSHLRQLSRFYKSAIINNETSYEQVESITAPQTEIYVKKQSNQLVRCAADDVGSILVGTTGSGEFWYTDDRPGNYITENNPIFIFATIDTSKFNDEFTQRTDALKYVSPLPYGIQNMQPAVFPGIKTRYNPADHLSITTTGIDGEGTLSTTKFDIPEISWQETDIPFIIKFKDNAGYTTKNYPPLSSSYVENVSIPPLSAYDVQLGVGTYKDGILQPLQGISYYEDFTTSAPQTIGAFYKGYFKSSQSSENCVLTASVNVVEPVFYSKDSIVGWVAIPQYNSAFRILRQETHNIDIRKSKLITFTSDQSYFPTDDNRNIYAITVSPSGANPANDYQAWIADFVNDKLFKYDIYGNLLPVYYTTTNTGALIPSYAYTLSAMPVIINNQIIVRDYRAPLTNDILPQASPNSIALDRNNNIWVTLFDSGSAIKIGANTGYVTTVAYIDPITSNYSLSATTLSSSYIPLSGFAGESVVLPSSIDIDQDNNAWIAYAHPSFSRLVKYQGEGNETLTADILLTIAFPTNVTPDEICIDRNRFVWVTAQNHSYDRVTFSTSNDLLYKYDLDGNLLPGFPLSGFKQIGNLTIDGQQNAWVTQDRETLTKISYDTNETTNYIAGSGNNNTNYICSIGGLTCDTSNNIWVINNFDKKLYMINSDKPPGDYFSYEYEINLNSENLVANYSDGTNAFQAYGDWNGYKWINKYSVPYSTVRTITGASNLFNIYPSTGSFNISKINENWNASGYYNSLRYQESLLDKQVFFDKFLGVILGGLEAQPYELGKTVYEKIANFIDNRSDIDKCNLNALLNFCKELSIDLEEYNYLFPPQIRRLVDLLSIKQSNLWGTQNKYTLNFDNRGTMLVNDAYGINLGTEIDPTSGIVSLGVPVVAYELFSGNYTVVNTNIISNVTPISGTTNVPISTYNSSWGWCLAVPDSVAGTGISSYYKFYNFNSIYNDTFYNSIIDWNNPLTTLTFTNSSYEKWSKDDGIMQSLLSYELTKGFKLFTSATNITYNS